MTPQELQRMEKLEQIVSSIVRGENIAMVKNLERIISFPPLALDDLSDVQITSPSTGQVIKRSGSLWVNDTDNV